ncbi:MAG: GWxTD domain-containing protein [Acidobacteriales bacterium]|nr:GWxTD domain-containing protein [Terriglobales bacterium]
MSSLPGWLMSPDCEPIAKALLHFLWQGAAIGVLAALYFRFAAREPAERRYGVACLALAAMAAAPVLTWAWFWFDGASGAGTRTVQLQPLLLEDLPWQDGGQGAGQDWMKLVIPFWLLGVLALALRAAGGWAWIRVRMSRQSGPMPEQPSRRGREITDRLGITRGVRFLRALHVETPCTYGWWRPVVVLPLSALANLPPEQVEAILAHELAHIARHDFLVNLLQTVVETLLFYHPAVWWLSGRIRQEREVCADAMAAQLCGDRFEYSRALVALEECRASLAPAAGGGSLKDRIRLLVDPRHTPASGWPAVLLLLPLIALGGLLLAPQAVRSENKPKAESLKKEQKLRKELGTPYRKWVSEDVVYIITAEERKAFDRLRTDEEREKFIVQFWLRRDPTPGTAVNEFKEEHYRRIAYANERFEGDVPGWRTSRGRIYIQDGPPDEVESHPAEFRESWRYNPSKKREGTTTYEFQGQDYKLVRMTQVKQP